MILGGQTTVPLLLKLKRIVTSTVSPRAGRGGFQQIEISCAAWRGLLIGKGEGLAEGSNFSDKALVTVIAMPCDKEGVVKPCDQDGAALGDGGGE